MALDAVARTHHGLVTFERAEKLGMSRSAWRRAATSKRLIRVSAQVARLPGSPITIEQAIYAAVLSCGPGAMASHRAAAYLWGGGRPIGELVDIVLADPTRHPRATGVLLHRPSRRELLKPSRRGVIPCVSPLRVLLDLGAVDPNGVEPFLRHVLSTHMVSLATVQATLAKHAVSGRNGITALRAAVEEVRIDGKPTDSELESVMADVIQRFRLPPMTFHATVAGYEVDFLVDGVPVVVECTGWYSHGLDRDQFEFDTHRRSVIQAAGYGIVEVTWRQLTRAPQQAVARINAMITKFS